MLKKIILISTVSILLAGCQSNLKNNKNDHIAKVNNIDFQAQSLKDNYFQYVNTSDLVNMPPINNDLKNYLFAQVVSNATNIRETVESREKFDDKMKDATCGDLPTKLCNYNAHLYSGSYFGLKLYEKANNQDLLGHSIVAAPLTMWSISWLKKSYNDGLNLAKQCSTADNTCLNQHATNPVEKLVAICKVKSPDQMNDCIGVVLNQDQNKDFAFITGYITGYNISYNVGNGLKK